MADYHVQFYKNNSHKFILAVVRVEYSLGWFWFHKENGEYERFSVSDVSSFDVG
jgi:hypothetical protein